ncbi:MAG TPA: response regulator [Thermoanaerobaculia bacterium]|nr:response regulator [Thermoanaerobaculia bacterium]
MIEQILLVEDNPRDVEIALELISQSPERADVIVATDGEEALDFLRRKGKFRLRPGGLPSVILLDVKMPKLDGFEVLGRLRDDPSLNAIPVVMLTASRQEQDLLAAYELKSDGYLMKPLRQGQLEDAIRRARASAASRTGQP